MNYAQAEHCTLIVDSLSWRSKSDSQTELILHIGRFGLQATCSSWVELLCSSHCRAKKGLFSLESQVQFLRLLKMNLQLIVALKFKNLKWFTWEDSFYYLKVSLPMINKGRSNQSEKKSSHLITHFKFFVSETTIVSSSWNLKFLS